MTLPKRCRVSCCERRLIISRCSPAAGEMSAAKSVSVGDDLATASRAAAELVANDWFTSAASGNELNAETKLTRRAYQNSARSRGSQPPQNSTAPDDETFAL